MPLLGLGYDVTKDRLSPPAPAGPAAARRNARIGQNPVMTLAVVLGGGGVAGVAWEAGLVLGLQRAGIDLALADVVVGTSAGSIVGSWLASGASLEQLAALAAAPAGGPGAAASRGPAAGPGAAGRRGPAASAGLDRILAVMAPLFDPALDPAEARRQVGVAALAADAGSEARHVERIAALLPERQRWPGRRLLVTGVDAGTGKPAVWDGSSGVPLARAVAASCAVPGLYPPVTVGGRRYMDGGVRSATNADLAAGASTVIVLNVLAHLVPADPLTAELAALGAASTLVISPDEAAAAAMGAQLMDPAVAAPALAAALAQAASCADTVRASWPGR